MSLSQALTRRYASKAYDPSRSLPDETVQQLLQALRLSPSSVNCQPWHFFVAADAAGKARLARATEGAYAYNAPKVRDASHVLLLCARTTLPAHYLEHLLDQEQADGRFADAKARAGQQATRAMYVDKHVAEGDLAQWAGKQTYLALGGLLLAAGLLGVDATPMEGFDAQVLSAELGLDDRGLSPQVLVALGHHGEADFNARLPKSRLPEAAVFSVL